MHSPLRLKPGSFQTNAKKANHTIDRVASDTSLRSSSFERAINNISLNNRLGSIPKYHLSRRSGSTYGDTFGDSPEKRSKSKALNENVNFRLEELKNNCKFPPIPKGKLGEEYVQKNPIHLKLNDFTHLSTLDAHVKKAQLNRTVDSSTLNLNKNGSLKLKQKHARKNSILARIAETNNLADILSRKKNLTSIHTLLKTNIDRPKVFLVQDTLQGVLQTSPELKLQQRKAQKFQHWGGMKIPINSKLIFNKHKDPLNKWDECRDGVFHQL